MSVRPVITLRRTKLELILMSASLILAIFLFGLTFYVWGDLPDKIPVHFNFFGEPDRWGGKASILIWPIIALFVVKATYFIGKAPHMFNYPVIVTEDNARHLYLEARLLLVFMQIEIVALITAFHIDILLKTYGKAGLSGWVSPSLGILLIATIILSLLRMIRLKKMDRIVKKR